MKLETAVTSANSYGDFYAHYRRFDSKGLTYLVGTLEFDNSYILKRLENRVDPCGLPFAILKKVKPTDSKAKRLSILQKLADSATERGSILLFSWSSDRFRVIPAHAVTRVTPLSTVLRNDGY